MNAKDLSESLDSVDRSGSSAAEFDHVRHLCLRNTEPISEVARRFGVSVSCLREPSCVSSPQVSGRGVQQGSSDV